MPVPYQFRNFLNSLQKKLNFRNLKYFFLIYCTVTSRANEIKVHYKNPRGFQESSAPPSTLTFITSTKKFDFQCTRVPHSFFHHLQNLDTDNRPVPELSYNWFWLRFRLALVCKMTNSIQVTIFFWIVRLNYSP